MERKLSQKIHEEACEIMPGGVSSPVRSCKEVNISPLVVSKGKGPFIWDEDGYKFLDYCGSWGALILGHVNDDIIQAVSQQIHKGTSFGISTKIEKDMAQKIRSIMPSMENIRFVSSGTESTMSALRLARGYTKRDKIIKFSGQYHGHHDSLLVDAGSGVALLNPQASSLGVSQNMIKDTIVLPFNDSKAFKSCLEKYGHEIAAVILEPISGNMGVVPADRSFLEFIRSMTKDYGVVLIFDEVMTGFRVALGGAQSLYGIYPDLTCVAKIVGGGFPCAAFGGQKEIMSHLAPLGEVYQAGTLSGNPVAMAAGLTQLTLLEKEGVYQALEAKGERLLKGIQNVLESKKIGCVNRVGSMFTIFFGVKEVKDKASLKNVDLARFRAFFHFLLDKGIYMPPSQYESAFISLTHEDEHLDYTRESMLEFFSKIDQKAS